MVNFRKGPERAGFALALLWLALPATAFESLDDENLSGAVVSQPDDVAFGKETAGEDENGREPGDASELIRAGRVAPPQQFRGDRINLTILRG
ncbi:MAG: hypothetical protein K0S16_135 [Moraxellaceae bacterium]|jgi:hypothetical protein|nr:hypothetical protein [Moraxellaceae bacterium]